MCFNITNRMNGIFILITIIVYFGILLGIPASQPTAIQTMMLFFLRQQTVAMVYSVIRNDRSITVRSYICIRTGYGKEH